MTTPYKIKLNKNVPVYSNIGTEIFPIFIKNINFMGDVEIFTNDVYVVYQEMLCNKYVYARLTKEKEYSKWMRLYSLEEKSANEETSYSYI